MWSARWQRRLAEEEKELDLEEEWKVFAHSWEEAQFTVESVFHSVGAFSSVEHSVKRALMI